jgi:poly(3-hydroxyalkanoate) synthetase
MQLIQYAPSTPTVQRRPLLIVPPWINKFYILDLKPKNSVIKWCVEQGHTVFVISWVNPGAELADKSFADYLLEGPLQAISAIEKATGESEVNVIGYCIGGTLVASTLAYMAATNDRRIASATLFTSLLDFSDVGDISVFIDEDQLQLADKHMNRLGYLEGHHMEGVPPGRGVQPHARKRFDLVLCHQQLPVGSQSRSLRPSVLEFGLNSHAGQDAVLLFAQHVPQERTEEGRRN